MNYYKNATLNFVNRFRFGKIILSVLVIIALVTLLGWRFQRPAEANNIKFGTGTYAVTVNNDAVSGNTVIFTADDSSSVLTLGEQNGVLAFSSAIKGSDFKSLGSAQRTVDAVSPGQINKIVINGGAGDNTLIINNPAGTVLGANAEIDYNGGSGFDTLVVEGGGGPDFNVTYTPGPTNDAGLLETTNGKIKQTIRFTGLEPVQDNAVADTLTINGTAGDNVISYSKGPGGGVFTGNTGLVAVDNSETYEFNNKKSLILDGLTGADTINVNNPTTPAALTSIVLDPATVNLSGAVAAVAVTIGDNTPGSANPNTVINGYGAPITVIAANTVNLDVNGQAMTATATRQNDNTIYTPTGATAATFFDDIGSGNNLAPNTVFNVINVSGNFRVFNDSNGNADQVTLRATDARDLIEINQGNGIAQVLANNVTALLPVELGISAEILNVQGLGGENTFQVIPAPGIAGQAQDNMLINVDGGASGANNSLVLGSSFGNSPAALPANVFVVVNKNPEVNSGIVRAFTAAVANPDINYKNVQVVSPNVAGTGVSPNLAVIGPDLNEPNEQLGTAAFLGTAGTVLVQHATIFPHSPELPGTPADNDYYRVVAQSTGTLDFQLLFRTYSPALLPGGGNLSMQVLDTTGAILGTGTTDVSIPATAGQSYFLHVSGATAAAVNGYDVSIINNGSLNLDSTNANVTVRVDPGDPTNIQVLHGATVLRNYPNNPTSQINIVGGGEDNTITIDSSNGLVNAPINYDGGGGHNALALTQTGGAAQTSDTYTPGPNLGAGRVVITGPSGTQTVTFQNLAPVFDNVPAASAAVNGTNGDNAINYAQGPGGGIFVGNTGLITVDNLESYEFNNKTNIVINGLAGSDTISLNNPNVPAGLTGNVTVNGDDPTGSDTLIVNNVGRNIVVEPTAQGAGTITYFGGGLPNSPFTGIEHLKLVATSTNPFGIDGTAGDDQFTYTPGATPDTGSLVGTMNTGIVQFPLVPITFVGMQQAGVVVFNTFGQQGGTDSVVFNGMPSSENINMNNGGVFGGVTLIDTANGTLFANLNLNNMAGGVTAQGNDGDDVFTHDPNIQIPVTYDGGNPSGSDVLNFSGINNASTVIDFSTSAINSVGSGQVNFVGIETINETSTGGSSQLTVNGTSNGDNITFTPTGANAGTVTLAGLNPVIKFNGPVTLVLLGADGNDFFNITPSSTLPIGVFGGNPVPPASPGDSLSVNLAGTTGASQTNSSGPTGLSGSFTFTNRQPVTFQEIETLSPLAVTANGIDAVEGVPFSNQLVGSFTAASVTASNFTATINWGDGTASTGGVITAGGNGAFNVLGGHTYLEEGTYNVTIQVTDATTSITQTAIGTANVADAPLSIVSQPPGAATQFSGIGGSNVAGLALNAKNAFQAAIGGANNGGTPAPQPNGFRIINWDGVAMAANDGTFTNQVINADTVGIPTNRFQERGMNFAEVYAVSDDGFTSVNGGVALQFPAFSPNKTFAMFNENTIEFNFVLPSTHGVNVPIQGVTRGFGAIFLDVETANTTSIEYFSGTTSLGKFFVPVGASGEAQFFGVLFQNPVVTNVVITLGNATLFNFDGVTATAGPADAPPTTDLAVTDDFVYPEPQAVATGININAIVNAPFTAKVASFTDADPNGQLSDYSVVIDWGDGTSSAGGVSPNAANPESGTMTDNNASITPAVNGGWDVTGTHTYTSVGVFTITTSIRDIGGSSISASSTATVVGQPSLSISDVAVTEGNSGTTNAVFNVTLSAASSQSVTVGYFTADGTATANSDYQPQSGTLTFPAGVTTRTITVPVIGDLAAEANETFFVNLVNPVNASILKAQGIGTINDDDTTPSLSINDVAVTEGNSGTTNAVFTVTLSAASSLPVTVDYLTADGTATANSDYQPQSSTLTFAPGTTTRTIIVPVIGDLAAESTETFFVNLLNPVNATISKSQGIGTINDDDSTPSLSINDVAVTEGNSGTTNAVFTVTLSAASSVSVTVDYFTADGTATANSDYQPQTSTLLFAPGVTTRTITVPVIGDLAAEANETFSVNLANPLNATISKAQGIGTINDDDTTPSLSINNVTVTEGNSGTTNAQFTVTLSAASSQTVTVDYVTGDGTATAPSDYDSQAGTLTFPAGTTTRTINVAVKGDTTPEPNENFFVNLLNPVNASIAVAQGTATVNDDDEAGFVQFSASTATVGEAAGTVTLTINRTGDTSGVTTVNFETSDGTAVQKSDYTFNSGVVQFNPGETSKTIKISIVDDVFVEGGETFKVTLSNVSGNFVINNPGVVTVTITDNDVVAPVTNPIDDPTFFVRQHYLDFLGREPDAGGLAFWVGQINACAGNASCIAAARVNTSAAFFLSIEYQETSGAVIRLQRAAFGRFSADPALRYPYLPFMRDTRQVGAGVVVGQAGYATVLENNKQAYALQLVNSQAFLDRFPIMPAATYVDAVIASTGLTLTAPERTAAINAFGAGGTLGRVAALRSVADSNTVRQAEMLPSFVLAEYYGYLRRGPLDAPEFSDSGFQFWLAKLTAFNGDFVKAEMVKAFINSGEYRQRFGP